jgi:WD40 repeat protein
MTALPFTPTGSHLYKTFHDKIYCPYIAGDGFPSWSPVILTIPDRQSPCYPISALKILPHRILSCGVDVDGNAFIYALDAATGTDIAPPVEWHKDDSSCISISHDGGRVVLGTNDGTICMWDTADGLEVLPSFLGHEQAVKCLAFSNDGSRIISGSADKTICVWDTVTRAMIHPPLTGHEGEVSSIALSSDGTRILSGSEDHTIRVWDTSTGSMLLTPSRNHEGCVAFSPDGTRIASELTDNTIHLWDVKDGTVSERTLAPEGHEQVLCLAFSFDSTRIASGSFNGTIRIWDATSGATVQLISEPSVSIGSLAYHPDGKHIISSGVIDDSISVWDISSGIGEVLSPQGMREGCEAVMFSPDGMLVISASCGGIHTWNATSGQKIRSSFRSGVRHNFLAFSPGGTRIALRDFGRVMRILDADTEKEVLIPLPAELINNRSHHLDIYSKSWPSVVFSPKGNLIAANLMDNTIQIWDAMSGKEISPPLHRHEKISCMAFSPDERRIVANSREGTVRGWDIASSTETLKMTFPEDGQRAQLVGHPPCAFSDDGTRISSMSSRDTYSLWDATSGNYISNIDEFDFNRDFGRYPIVLGYDGWLWIPKTEKYLCKLPSMLGRDVEFAATQSSVALGTGTNKVFVLHFPPYVMTSRETQAAEDIDEEDEDMVDSDTEDQDEMSL